MDQEQTALVVAPGRLAVRDDVELVVQTQRQQGVVLSILVVGLLMIFLAIVGNSTGIAPIVAGAAMGASLAKVRTLGRGRLRHWVAALDKPERRERALARLEYLATRAIGAVTSVRVEAAAHVVLARIEAGELDAAAAVMRAAYRDGGPNRTQRQRLADQGFLGEAVAALVGRLLPGSLAEVVPADRIVYREASGLSPHPAFELVIPLVRALEATAAGGRASALTAWRDACGKPQAAKHPVLVTWVAAAIVSHFDDEDDLAAELARRLDGLDAQTRAAIVERHARLADLGRQDYRTPAPDAGHTRALVPVTLQNLATGPTPTRWLPAVSRRNRNIVALALALISIQAIPRFLAGDLVSGLELLLFATVFAPSFVAAPIWRRRRRELLEREGVLEGDRSPRRHELELMPARGGPARSDAASLHPLDLDELRVLVGLQRAELELMEGNVAAARGWISWWLDTAAEQGFGGISPLAIGASALRVATLTGHRQAAATLEQQLAKPKSKPDPRLPRSPRVRSGHGDAERAVSLARALVRVCDGKHAAADKLLRRKPGEAIELDAFERGLYGALAQRLAREGIEPPTWLQGLGQPPAELAALLDAPGV